MQHEDMIIELSQNEIEQVSGAVLPFVGGTGIHLAIGGFTLLSTGGIAGVAIAGAAAAAVVGVGIHAVVHHILPKININWGCRC